MTSPSLSNNDDKGFITIDVILALAVVGIISAGMAAASIQAEEIVDRAAERSMILDAYQAHASEFAGLEPYASKRREYAVGSSSEPVTVDASARWYGNDMVETDITAAHGKASVRFVAVRSIDASGFTPQGTALCSPDPAGPVVGSYGYLIDKTWPIRVSIDQMNLPIDPLLSLTDLEVRGDIAYVSANPSVAALPDLFVVDISNKSQPTILAALDTGPGLSALSIAGKYIFAAALSAAAELHVIRLDSLQAPVLVSKYRLPKPEATTTMPAGSAIFYDDGYIYLGTEKWDGDELSVISVANPEHPVMTGSIKTGGKVNDIFVRNGLAYAASSDPDQLRMIDIRDKADPRVISSFSPSGSGRQQGKSLAYFEDSLVFGRTSGGFDIATDHEAFSWQAASSSSGRFEPMRPQDVSKGPASMNIPGGVYGLLAGRGHIFIATRSIDQEFTIYDRNLSTSTASYYPLPVAPQTMVCDRDRLYILAKTAPVIYEVSFTNP